jgi:hypothetical protein
MNESRIKELLNWLDDKAADTSLPYREMANYRDVSTAMRQMIQRESSAQLLTEKWRRQSEGSFEVRANALFRCSDELEYAMIAKS